VGRRTLPLPRKIPTKTMRKLQGKVVLTMAAAGGKVMIQGTLKVSAICWAKNGPHVTDRVMANGRAKVSKGLQKRVAVVIAEQKQPSKPCGAPSIQSPGLESPAI
jgi:hypothetical protein